MPQEQRQDFNSYDKKANTADTECIKNTHNNKSNNSKNNKCYQNDRLTVEHAPNMRETFNYEKGVDSVACNASTSSCERRKPKYKISETTTPIKEHAYENLKFDLDLSKHLLLHRYFRSTERAACGDYENLCRGCGYGVFEARGYLCNFCECIVHGVQSQTQVRCGSPEQSENASANIYENVCERCGRIYGEAECDCDKSITSDTNLLSTADSDKDNGNAVATLVESDQLTGKLKKSKSFGKREKRSILQGLLGTLKRAKSPRQPVGAAASATLLPAAQSPCPNKRLEIVHNVDGFENVFRTQETFDLQRICELKRSQTSCSDQHIYGRLKITHTSSYERAQSHDPLLEAGVCSTDSLNSNCTNSEQHSPLLCKPVEISGSAGKRPRISKPRLLRTRSHNSDTYTPPAQGNPKGNSSNKNNNKSTSQSRQQTGQQVPAKQSIYLADSVCHWMTSLRREVHNYRSCAHGAATDAVDDNNFATCHPKSIPAKNALIYGASGSGVSGVVDSHLRAPVNFNNDFAEVEAEQYQEGAQQVEQRQQGIPPVDQMVEDFKRNLVARKMQQQQQQQQSQRRLAAGVEPGAAQSASRLKRQAIYLHLEDGLYSNSKNNNNNNNKSYNHTDSDSNNNNATSNKQNNSNSSANDNYKVEVNFNCSDQRTSNNSSSLSSSSSSPASPAPSPSPQPQSLSSYFDEAEGAAAAIAQRYAGQQGLVSRRAAHNAITSSSSKRCGIYERDSEFVNDILSAFETFLQREDQEDRSDQKDLELIGQSDVESLSAAKFAETLTCDQEEITEITSGIDVLLGPVAATSCAATDCNNILNKQVIEKTFDVFRIINDLFLSLGLNTVVVCYEAPLCAFLRVVYAGNTSRDRLKCAYWSWSRDRLVRKYQRFHAYCAQLMQRELNKNKLARSVEHGGNLALRNGGDMGAERAGAYESVLKQAFVENGNGSGNSGRESVTIVVKRVKPSDLSADASVSAQVVVEDVLKSVETEKSTNKHKQTENVVSCSGKSVSKVKNADQSQVLASPNSSASSENSSESANSSPRLAARPRVPARDPKTVLTHLPPPLVRESHLAAKAADKTSAMTVPTASSTPTHVVRNANNNNDSNHHSNRHATIVADEESIYQPIWKFQTVGEVPERYHTDADYYDIDSVCAATSGVSAADKTHLADDDSSPMPSILISLDVEDHNEWETDDEFMFSTQPTCCEDSAADSCSVHSSTMRSNRSGSSVTGSTVTGFGSSTITLASVASASLTHHLFRNIGIFYSLTEIKLRAVIYDYDRIYSSLYFAKAPQPDKQQLLPNQIAASECRSHDSGIGKSPQERSPMPPPRTTSAAKTKATTNTAAAASATGESGCEMAKAAAPPKLQPQLVPDSVLAWKFMLLDVNYNEDEEDLIVAESEILRAQEVKEDFETRQMNQMNQINILQRFKSISVSNLIDEDDKKSIAERMRDKLQRGVFKLNVRSPKSEKKIRGIFRRAEATSLYLEDGVKPKYPIFNAPLDQLELNQSMHPHVPRFVVDCVEHIERKDCINQDGLYRASGNKVAIDELKQKLSETYFYDPKLLVANDIHTLTSLLKQFFRELGAPLIPQEMFDRPGANLTDAASLATLRQCVEELPEPNRSTLKFLVKHLTNVAANSSENRMPASNLAIVWGPCIFSPNKILTDIGRMNTFVKVLIEHYGYIFNENERLVS